MTPTSSTPTPRDADERRERRLVELLAEAPPIPPSRMSRLVALWPPVTRALAAPGVSGHPDRTPRQR